MANAKTIKQFREIIGDNYWPDEQRGAKTNEYGMTKSQVIQLATELAESVTRLQQEARLDEQERTCTIRYRPDKDGDYGKVYFYNNDGSTVKSQAARITELQQLMKEGK